MSRRTVVSLGVCLLLLAATGVAAAKDLDKFARFDPASTLRIDHGAWDAFLERHLVAGRGTMLVRYGAVTAADRAALQDYISMLAAVDVPALPRAGQKAYWINLYNALTVDLILEHYPVESIREISGGLFRRGPWRDDIVTVCGVTLTLDDIEHEILRGHFSDPMIHYGLNCAALGCPPLRRRAYRGADLDAALAANARAYVNGPHGILGLDGRKAGVSSIYVWYREDFGRDDAEIFDHLRRFARGARAEALRRVGAISGHDYDWALNDAALLENHPKD